MSSSEGSEGDRSQAGGVRDTLESVALKGAATAFGAYGLTLLGIPYPAAGVIAAGTVNFFDQVGLQDATRVQTAMTAEQLNALEPITPVLEAHWAELNDMGKHPSVSDVASIYGQWSRAWANADPETRRILHHAFAGAFKPELYTSGLVADLFGALNGLQYGDLRLLAVCVRDEQRFRHDKEHQLKPDAGGFGSYRGAGNSMIDHHARKLRDAHLLRPGEFSHNFRAPDGSTVVRQRYLVTPFGEKLAELVAEAKLAEELGEIPREK